MKKQIEINLSNKVFYTITSIVAIILLGVIVYAGNYANSITGAGHDTTEFGEGTIGGVLTIFNSKIGIGTTNPQAELDVAGKIISLPTNESDSDDTVVTKSYLGAAFSYTTCGWRNGSECLSDEIMNGYSPTQVKCCGIIPINCTPTNWQVYDSYCNVDCTIRCGWFTGKGAEDQMRVMDDCEVQYRKIITNSNCGIHCGSCTGLPGEIIGGGEAPDSSGVEAAYGGGGLFGGEGSSFG